MGPAVRDAATGAGTVVVQGRSSGLGARLSDRLLGDPTVGAVVDDAAAGLRADGPLDVVLLAARGGPERDGAGGGDVDLDGAARDSCLRDVVRIDDRAATQTATNQLTYACVVEHFVCDPRTGHETRESAQAQHDCTDDLD